MLPKSDVESVRNARVSERNEGMTPILVAAQKNRLEVVRLLLELNLSRILGISGIWTQRLDIHPKVKAYLWSLCGQCKHLLCKLPRKAEMNVSTVTRGVTALHFAVQNRALALHMIFTLCWAAPFAFFEE